MNQKFLEPKEILAIIIGMPLLLLVMFLLIAFSALLFKGFVEWIEFLNFY